MKANNLAKSVRTEKFLSAGTHFIIAEPSELVDPRKVCITLIDSGAYLVDLFEELVFFGSQLCVVTDSFAPYESLAEKLLKKYGVSLLVCAKLPKDAQNSTFIISDSILPVPMDFSGVLFTNEKKRLEKEAFAYKKDLDAVNKKLSNENFINKAKQEAIEIEKRKQKEFEDKLKGINEVLSSF